MRSRDLSIMYSPLFHNSLESSGSKGTLVGEKMELTCRILLHCNKRKVFYPYSVINVSFYLEETFILQK